MKKNLFNKIKKHRLLLRIISILFFIGLNIILGINFIENNEVHLPKEIVNILNKTDIVKKEKINYLEVELKKKSDLKLDPQLILEKLNEERSALNVDELEYSDSLASVAAILLNKAKDNNYNLENINYQNDLKNALDKVGYKYSHVSHNIVIGPAQEQAVVDAWFSDKKQIEAIKNNDFKEVGFATDIADLENIGTVGIVVQVLGKPMKKNKVIAQQAIAKKTSVPNISDSEVFEALNNYRISHKVNPLNLDNNLCEYASKRVQDLIKFGGLDDHAGFKKDLADKNNLPEPIKKYPGSVIAENLAHQYCKNMTTGDSFIAQTGTAIIEWCFDSSTKGHREAQLNKDFKNACVRHGNNMYVVMFGN